jgi:hypothetical protein
MEKTYNAPVTYQVYLGTGEKGKKLLENILKAAGTDSFSEFIVAQLKIANPKLFKGIEEKGK